MVRYVDNSITINKSLPLQWVVALVFGAGVAYAYLNASADRGVQEKVKLTATVEKLNGTLTALNTTVLLMQQSQSSWETKLEKTEELAVANEKKLIRHDVALERLQGIK